MTTTRPDPTAADLLTAARALLARAEAMLSEHPTAETPEPLGTYTPHRVNLTGWRDLGIVPARWLDGGRLEVQHPEHGGIYGPSALYRVQRAEPAEAAPTPSKPDRLGSLRAAVESAAVLLPPLGYAVGVDHGNGPDAIVSVLASYHYEPPAWTATTASKPEPKPAGVLLRGWVRSEPGWRLVTTTGTTIAFVGGDGWTIYTAPLPAGPETGLHGKERAVKRLLTDGARWESPAAVTAAMDHDTRAINRFYTGDVAVMVDGSKRQIEAVMDGLHKLVLFQDGGWLSFDAAETAIAARIPADDIPF